MQICVQYHPIRQAEQKKKIACFDMIPLNPAQGKLYYLIFPKYGSRLPAIITGTQLNPCVFSFNGNSGSCRHTIVLQVFSRKADSSEAEDSDRQAYYSPDIHFTTSFLADDDGLTDGRIRIQSDAAIRKTWSPMLTWFFFTQSIGRLSRPALISFSCLLGTEADSGKT